MRSSLPGRHELGQNFLVDRAVLDRIVVLVRERPGPIVEWGAGDGAITLAWHRSARLPRDLRAED
jgi:16S rRNA A1518/A1519 N6-dimethyltransferase RsmA/KsgA/DIM1 with predicted DNA glycosylase/AP lyase activity